MGRSPDNDLQAHAPLACVRAAFPPYVERGPRRSAGVGGTRGGNVKYV